MKMGGILVFLITGAVAFSQLSPQPMESRDWKSDREEGEFRIYVAGKEVGSERYLILVSADSASSSSVVEFRDPGQSRQRVHFETKLEMNGRFLPRRYELKSDVEGKTGTILGSFDPNQALFEYRSSSGSMKKGLLVGNQYTLLDTNVFHHFIFLARLFEYSGKGKTQKREVVIPQETDSGLLRITELKKENILVRGKSVGAHCLEVDSGSLVMQLWVDDQHVLHKIAVKGKGIEVVRNP